MFAYLLMCTINAQDRGLSQNISYTAVSVSFQTALAGFEQRIGLPFQYDASLAPSADKKFSFRYNQVRASQALQDFLAAAGLRYEFENGQIFLKKRLPQNIETGYRISGRILSAGNGEFIGAATVGTAKKPYMTTTSDAGFFSLLLPAGKNILQITYPGYNPIIDTLIVDRDYNLQYEMLKQSTTLDAVQIQALKGRGLQSVVQGQTDQHEMNRIRLGWMPQLLGEPDVVRTLSMLPGVVGGSEGMLGMYVRGGAADQNLVLLDDMPVFNSYHLFGVFSVFNDDALRSARLLKGSFPARYGGRLSSVISVQSKEGNRQKLSGIANVGLLSGRVFLEGPIRKDRTTFTLSMRRSYIDFLAGQAASFLNLSDSINPNNLYYFWDLNTRITHRFNSKSRISAGFYGGQDIGGLIEYSKNEQLEISTEERKKQLTGWGNRVAGIKWNYQARTGLEWLLRAHITRYRYEYSREFSFRRESKISPQTDVDDYTRYELENGIQDMEAAWELRMRIKPGLVWEQGFGIANHRFIPGNRKQYSRINKTESDLVYNDARLNVPEYFTYTEFQYNGKRRWIGAAGLRLGSFRLPEPYYFVLPEPRLNIKYRLKENQFLHASATRNRQFFHLLNNLSLGLPGDIWVPSNRQFQPGRADQLSLGYAQSRPSWSFSTDVFYRSFNHILEYKDNAGYVTSGKNWEDAVTSGNGEAYGLEVLAEKTAGKLNGWISYTLMWNNRWFADLNNGLSFPARYDRRHNIYLAGVYHWKPNIDINAAWTFNSGFAYTLPVATYSSPTPNDPYRDIFIYGNRNNARAADNHRLDISITLQKQRKGYVRYWTMGVFNVYNRFNPFYINPGFDKLGNRKLYQVSMLPLLPNISYKITF
ncbi:MAG: hypothetical protein EBV15_00255 [Bacteroidetes bacterium]|nr:hypothetical protein [Bacteroidota bacterium]